MARSWGWARTGANRAHIKRRHDPIRAGRRLPGPRGLVEGQPCVDSKAQERTKLEMSYANWGLHQTLLELLWRAGRCQGTRSVGSVSAVNGGTVADQPYPQPASLGLAPNDCLYSCVFRSEFHLMRFRTPCYAFSCATGHVS